jgi:prepilin-type N-terminal cleavage/methylation domain-containing protein
MIKKMRNNTRAPAFKLRLQGSYRGFTLIELLVFLAIFASASAAFITVLLTATRLQVRQASVVEVSEQSQFLLQQIQYYIEKSSLIDIPQDTPTSTLKLWTGVNAQDPTYITLASGTVYLQQTATGTLQALTSNKVMVSGLTFTRRANAPSHDSVSISFTLAYNTSNIKQAFSQMFQTSIARVSAATFDSNIIPSSTGNYSLGTSALTWSSINQTIYFNGSNVGIGVASPPNALTVAGTIRTAGATGGIRLEGGLNGIGFTGNGMEITSDAVNGYVYSYNRSSSTYTPLYVQGAPVIINNAAIGNVGIDTVTPALPLDIESPTYALPAASGTTPTGKLRLKSTASAVLLDMGVNGSFPYGGWLQSTDITNLATDYPLSLNPNGGNVGIGTASPASLNSRQTVLEISASSTGAGGLPGLVMRGGSSFGNPAWETFLWNNAGTSTSWGLSNGTSVVMVASNLGNVGIGTLYPSQKLEVAGNISSTGLCMNGFCKTSWAIEWYGSSTATSSWIYSVPGYSIGIGTTTAVPSSTKLFVNGAIRATGGSLIYYMPADCGGGGYGLTLAASCNSLVCGYTGGEFPSMIYWNCAGSCGSYYTVSCGTTPVGRMVNY